MRDVVDFSMDALIALINPYVGTSDAKVDGVVPHDQMPAHRQIR